MKLSEILSRLCELEEHEFQLEMMTKLLKHHGFDAYYDREVGAVSVTFDRKPGVDVGLAWVMYDQHNDTFDIYYYYRNGKRHHATIEINFDEVLPDLQSEVPKLLTIKEEITLLTGIIANLLKKGEKVAAWAELWHQDPKKMKPKLYSVSKVEDNRVFLQVSQNTQSWFELNGDDPYFGDDRMYFQKEGDTWVLAEPKRKRINV